ncbi:hypothetical protein FRC00_004952 [Tulasnella sp. 408]|nr:hypothetical protein FRC00_004952 [Tulasnella sp. 408]
MTDTTPHIKGGQGVIMLGTLSLPSTGLEMFSLLKGVETALGLTPEIYEKWGYNPAAHFNKGLSERFAQLEALGIPKEGLNKVFHQSKNSAKLFERMDGGSKEQPSELKVAVKVLAWRQDDVMESAKFFNSFVHEVSLMTKLSHPNIVDLVGFVENLDKGDAWIILQWEENGNVREFLQSGQWDIPERISLIKDTASGLEYLHTQQPPICHGDLKSLNILVNSSYRAVITDFGSARIRQSVASEREETQSNTSNPVAADSSQPAGFTSPQAKFNPSTSDLTLTGPGFSLRWTAPEVLMDGMQDLPSDMWAMGWICWEIVTGKMPFQDLNREGAIIMHTITGKLPAITKDTDLSHVLGLCSLMSNCWLSEADKRVNASTFRLDVRDIPSKTPSGDNAGGQKVRSAALLLELGKMHQFQSNNPAKAEVHYQEALDIATRTKNEVIKASALFYLGEVLSLQSKYPEAEQASAEAHQVYSRSGNDLGAASALYNLGKALLNQEKNLEAEKAFREAHETFSRISRRRALADGSSGDSNLGAANALCHLGHIYCNQKKYPEAEKAFTEAREIYSRLGHEPGVANALEGQGELYLAQSRYNEAERALTESRKICFRAGGEIELARTLWRLGRVYESQSKIQEAEDAFKEARKLSSAKGDNVIAGHASRFLASLYSKAGRYDEAKESFHHALAAYEQTNDPDSRARTLLGLGGIHCQQHKLPEAEEAVSEALTIWDSIDNQAEQVAPLLLLSTIYGLQSRHDEERDTLIRLDAELARRNDGDARRAEVLIRLGDYHFSQGAYGESENCFSLAQAIALSSESPQHEGPALFGLGTSYACQRRFGDAEDCFAGARAAYATFANPKDEARALECLVEVYILQDKFDEARVACAEARDLCKTLGRPMRNICLKTRKPPSNLEEMDAAIQSNTIPVRNAQDSLRAGVLTRFGYDHLRRGAFKDGEECFRLAQGISPGLEMAHERGVALMGLGMLFLVQKRIDEAEPCFVQSRVEFASIADGVQEATALDALTMLYNDAGRIGDARRTCTEARDIYLRMGQPMSALCAQIWQRLQDSEK